MTRTLLRRLDRLQDHVNPRPQVLTILVTLVGGPDRKVEMILTKAQDHTR